MRNADDLNLLVYDDGWNCCDMVHFDLRSTLWQIEVKYLEIAIFALAHLDSLNCILASLKRFRSPQNLSWIG